MWMKLPPMLSKTLLNMIETNSNENAFIVLTVKESIGVHTVTVTYCIFITPGVLGGCSAMCRVDCVYV